MKKPAATKTLVTIVEATVFKTLPTPDAATIKQRTKKYLELFSHHSFESIQILYNVFLSERPKGLKKSDMAPALAKAAAYKDEATFLDWFLSFPVFTQNLLYRLAFDYFVPVAKLESEFGLSLVHQESDYSWQKKWVFNKELGLSFIEAYPLYDQVVVILPHVIRDVLTDWLVPPPGFSLESCAANSDAIANSNADANSDAATNSDVATNSGAATNSGVATNGSAAWDNSAGIADSLPLLCDAMRELASHSSSESPYRNIRGFKVKDIKELQASSGFKPFDVPGTQVKAVVPDSTDLAARFILAMTNFSPTRPGDGQIKIKALVEAFFNEKSQYTKYGNPPDRHSLEFNVLVDHFAKSSNYSLSYGDSLPPSRRTLRDILMFCAKDGGTFDADKIALYIYRTRQSFSFCSQEIERSLKVKGEALTIDGLTYTAQYYNEFCPQGVFILYLLMAPLFKAYCYLFAALGILEITQEMPPLVRTQKNKNLPLSPYDSLKTFRVTEFGKWCLGLTNKRPARPKAEYQAIADKELLLVTVQGSSLERTVYLDRIGRKLGSRTESGTDRWRISPDSFIAGCVDKKQIEERIAKFKALIDPDPAHHWLALFEKALTRAALFDVALDDMLVYRLPADPSLAEELLRDTEFRALVHRAEGGLLVVPAKNRRKFYAVLNTHGIAVFNDV